MATNSALASSFREYIGIHGPLLIGNYSASAYHLTSNTSTYGVDDTDKIHWFVSGSVEDDYSFFTTEFKSRTDPLTGNLLLTDRLSVTYSHYSPPTSQGKILRIVDASFEMPFVVSGNIDQVMSRYLLKVPEIFYLADFNRL